MKSNANSGLFIVALILMIPTGAFAAGTVNDLVSMLNHLNTNIPMLRQMVAGFAYMIGLALIARSIFMLKKHGEARTMMSTGAGVHKPIIVLAVGVGLIFLPSLIDSSLESLYAAGSSSVMEYPAPTSWSSVINPLIRVVKLLGLIVFIKGWVMLARFGGEGGNQPGTGGKAVMHMIGGILAMNIVGTIDVIEGTFGL